MISIRLGMLTKLGDFKMNIYCCGCAAKVEAELTNGSEVYPHSKDLYSLPFWICRTCKNFVGCHHKTGNPTQPLGCIPTFEIKTYRKKIHAVLDPLWKSGTYGRKEIYEIISERVGDGRRYHTAQIRSVTEAQKVLDIVTEIAKEENNEKVRITTASRRHNPNRRGVRNNTARHGAGSGQADQAGLRKDRCGT